MSLLRSCVVLAALTFAAACSGTGDADSASSPDQTSEESSSQRADDAASTDFTADDLAAYERGFAHEIELVKQADATADTATTPEARNAARAAREESVTVPEGARVSGLGGRYEDIRETVHTTLRHLDYQGKIDGPTSYDTGTGASPAVREMFTKDHVAALPAGARAAFQARLEALAEQWGTYVRLTAVGG